MVLLKKKGACQERKDARLIGGAKLLNRSKCCESGSEFLW